MMICIPIAATDMKEAEQLINLAFTKADLLELRADYANKLDLRELLKKKSEKFIVTNRRKEEGGHFLGPDHERVKVLMDAVVCGAGYVDIEAATDEALLGDLFVAVEKFGRRTKIIVSHHDLSGTPPQRILRSIWMNCHGKGGDLIKIVTTATRIEDNLRLLGLIPFSLQRKQPVIAFCMGEFGRISRLMAPLIGSSICFVSLEKGRESAPGQWSIDDMEKIFEAVHELDLNCIPKGS
jgi:3-dehydroquinate dehydratase type I